MPRFKTVAWVIDEANTDAIKRNDEVIANLPLEDSKATTDAIKN